MSLPAVSKHLRVLEGAGLVSRGRDAQWRPARLEVLVNLGAGAENARGQVEAAIACAEEARALAAAMHDEALEADCLSLIGEAQVRVGRLKDGLDAAQRAHALGLQAAAPSVRARNAHTLAIGASGIGDYEAALAAAQEGLRIARASGNTLFVISNLVVLGNVHRALGSVDVAIGHHREALDINNSLAYPPRTELVSTVLCADLAVAQDWPRAAEHAREALLARDPSILYTGFYRWYETEALLRAGAEEEASDDLAHFGDLVGNNLRYRFSYLRALAVLQAWRGDLARAIGSLNAAAEHARRMCMTGELWQVCLELARVLDRAGEAMSAVQARDEAAEAARVVDH